MGMIGLEVLFSIQKFIFKTQNLSVADHEMFVTKTQEERVSDKKNYKLSYLTPFLVIETKIDIFATWI